MVLSWCQGRNFTEFWGVSEVPLRDFFVCDVCAVNFPAERSTFYYYLCSAKRQNFRGCGGLTHPHTPFGLVSDWHYIYTSAGFMRSGGKVSFHLGQGMSEKVKDTCNGQGKIALL